MEQATNEKIDELKIKYSHLQIELDILKVENSHLKDELLKWQSSKEDNLISKELCEKVKFLSDALEEEKSLRIIDRRSLSKSQSSIVNSSSFSFKEEPPVYSIGEKRRSSNNKKTVSHIIGSPF